MDRLSGRQLFFKAEIFQKGGAFKFRGACNAIMSLTPDEAAKGVVTHSSGNHAAAVALAASLRGIPASIVVPRDAPACKLDAVREYGGQLILCEPTLAAREAAAAAALSSSGGTFVPPYNHPHVIAGQGTIALELLEQVPNLDAIVVPVSGGGMLSGIAVAAKALNRSIRVVAAEPRGANDAADVAQCKAAGRLLEGLAKPRTIADGLQARLGSLTWPIVRDLVDGVVVVSDEQILAAMRLLFERMKLVVEPSGAAGLAAVLAAAAAAAEGGGGGASALDGCQRVAVILCGGNVDLAARGLWVPAAWQPAAA